MSHLLRSNSDGPIALDVTPESAGWKGLRFRVNQLKTGETCELSTGGNELAVGDRDLVLVTKGFHATAAVPNSKLYFLNYLAGELYDDERARPPHDDPKFAWIRQDWEANPTTLPLFGKGE